MEEFIKELLVAVGFAKKYGDICNSYPEYDKGMNFTKKQMEDIFMMCGFDLKYESKEKLFYKDYIIDSYNISIAITYKYGFIECFYTFLSSKSEERVRGRFNSIASIEDQDFRTKVAHNFPVATSMKDLEDILKRLMELHHEIIGLFKRKTQSIN